MNKRLRLKLSDIADNFDNQRIPLSAKQRKSIDKVFPYYGAQGIIDYVEEFLFDGEYILVAEDGENLKSQNTPICNLVCGKFWVNNHAHIIRAKQGYSTKYLCYYLNLLDFKPFTTGSAQPKLTKDNLNRIPLVVHDKEDQKLIASVLSALDAKIELNNRINRELEAMAKTLYDYWFVQFDFPITREQAMAMGKPELAGKPYKRSGGPMVYHPALKREIPEGWEVTVFNDWIKQTKAGDWGKESAEGNYTERVYCIRGADINGLNGDGELKSPERYILKKNIGKFLNPNDFIIEISGGSPTQSTARIALVLEKTFARFDSAIICSNFCKAVSIKDDKYVFNFKQEWQRLYDSGVFFGFEGKTSGIKNFLFESFMDSYHIVYPKNEIVEKYYEIAKTHENKKQSNLIENQQLASLRDWLLPMLMNGQVRVKEVGEMVPGLGLVAEAEVETGCGM